MSWNISKIDVPPGYRSVIYGASGLAHIGNSLQGNWLVSIPGLGYISLEDVGHQQGGPHYWAVRINGSQLIWYDGQGDMQIAVSAGGSFTMNGGISGWVRTPVPNCNMTMTGGANYCFCIFSSDAGTTQTINVLAGAPRLLPTLYPGIGHAPVPYAGFSVAGPNGITINSDTADGGSVHLTKTQKGVAAAIVDNPATGAWTVTVTADTDVPWYLMAHVYDANDAGLHSRPIKVTRNVTQSWPS